MCKTYPGPITGLPPSSQLIKAHFTTPPPGLLKILFSPEKPFCGPPPEDMDSTRIVRVVARCVETEDIRESERVDGHENQ
jgi:hypothetical protein